MKGSCLCGAVSMTVPEQTEVSACHCGICRRWGGGPAMAFHGGTDIRIEGEKNITRFRSSEWGERCFCSRCGTHLFFRLLGTGDHFVYPGFFGDDEGFELRSQIYIDCKPDYYAFANATEDLTEAEFLAKFAPPA